MRNVKKTKAEAGRLGGLATLKKHGVEHFRKMGVKGAKGFHRRYRLTPTGLNDFAIVNRATGDVIGFLNGMRS